MLIVAAEILPTTCRVAGLRVTPGRAATVVASSEWVLTDPDLVGKLRHFRRFYRLPQRARVAVWPRHGARGVVTPLARSAAPTDYVPTLTTVKIRDAVAPLVRAGYVVSSAIPAHSAIAGVGRRLDIARATLLAINLDGGAVVSRAGVAHFAWSPHVLRAHDANYLLTRYRLVAAILPRLTQLHRPTSDAIVACGNLPGLRSFVLPIVEEFDQDVLVVDQPDADVRHEADVSDEPDQIAALQVVLATALRTDPIDE